MSGRSQSVTTDSSAFWPETAAPTITGVPLHADKLQHKISPQKDALLQMIDYFYFVYLSVLIETKIFDVRIVPRLRSGKL